MSFHAEFVQAGAAAALAQEPHALHVQVLLPAQHDVFSLAILLDLLAAANRIAGHQVFCCEVAGAAALNTGLAALATKPAASCLVLIADCHGPASFPQSLCDSLLRLWQNGAVVGAWGAGVLALAKAGLLTQRSFALCAEARPVLATQWPELVPTDRSFCQQDRVLTSVGRFILSDMVLQLIQQRCGRKVMVAVMDHYLIQRGPEDSYRGRAQPVARARKIDPRVAKIDAWIGNNLDQRFSAQDVAGAFDLSTRHLERLFQRNLNRTPAAHIEDLRLAKAMRLMRETSLSVDDIARATGHGCRSTFQRRFKRKFGISAI